MTRSEREHPRYAHQAAITFHAEGRAFTGHTRNVSRGGLCADSPEALPTGLDLEVDVVLVFEGNVQSDALRLPVRVVWCTTVDEAYQIGLAFRPLDARRAELLAVLLRHLDDAQTEAAPRHKTVDDRFR